MLGAGLSARPVTGALAWRGVCKGGVGFERDRPQEAAVTGPPWAARPPLVRFRGSNRGRKRATEGGTPPTEGDPYRQRPTRTDSAGVGTGAGRRLGDVQRSRKSLFSGEGLGRGRRDCGPYRRFSAGGFGERRDNPWAGVGFRGGEA